MKNFRYHQIRSWQLNKALQTGDSMEALDYWIPSEVVLLIEGQKGDSNIEETLKAAGMEPNKVYHCGAFKAAGATILAKAAAEDAKAKKGSCQVICDGHHKMLGAFLRFAITGKEITPITAEVKAALAERIGREANIALQTAANLANDEKLAAIVHLRRSGVYKKQADLPFGSNDRGNHQNYWWRSEAVIVRSYDIEKISKLKWQICKELVEGKPYEEAILAAAKKNAEKVITSETVKMIATIATNADPEAKQAFTAILQGMAAGDNDGVKQKVAMLYARS